MQTDNTEIMKKIIQLIEDDPKIDSSNITVEVNDGVVTLKGKADTEAEKTKAEKLAASVEGVTSVQNHLHIGSGIAHTISTIISQISQDNNKK